MKRPDLRSAWGRSDLLRLMDEAGGSLPPEALRALNLTVVPPPPQKPKPSLQPSPQPVGEGKGDVEGISPKPPMPEPDVRQGERRLRFHRAVSGETLEEPSPEVRTLDPVSDKELAVNWAAQSPSAPPLMPWSRLAGGLRHRLGREVEVTRLDLRKLVGRVGRGLPLTSLPRLTRVQWASELLVVRDHDREMEAFRPDMADLIARVGRERGRHGIRIHELRASPGSLLGLRLPVATPVLALSAMGQMRGADDVMSEWVRVGMAWASEGRSFLALNPAPRSRWNPEVTGAWPTALWDRAGRLSRTGRLAGGASALSESEVAERKAVLERLLTLISTAVRVEPALLRLARWHVGFPADAGTEHDAWNAPGTWGSSECFGIEPGAGLEERLGIRLADPLASELGRLVVEHHRHCSMALVFECELRAALSIPDADGRMREVVKLLQRFVDRLEQIALHPEGNEAVESGVPEWMEDMVGRLSECMRRDALVQRLLSQAWAMAYRANRPRLGKPGDDGDPTAIPPGLDREVVRDTWVEVIKPAASRTWHVLAGVDGWSMEPDLPEAGKGRLGILGHMGLGRSFVTIGVEKVTPENPAVAPVVVNGTIDLPAEGGRVKIVGGRPASRVIVETDQQRLTFSPLRRPAWARSMAQDRFGLRATFEVRGVTFALRWIPPGSFWMGSPEDEPGRDRDEGPRHRVSITQGFWMGETPVTQEQWRAVVEEAGPRLSGLKPDPSHFKPRPDLPRPDRYSAQAGLPVESVSWNDCLRFNQLLSKLGGAADGEGLDFRLPTEAEWEHACRAETDTALYTGPIDIQDSKASALDDIAWYVHNSGPDVDVANPRDPREWRGEDFPVQQAGTRRVGMKRPNGWGLYDMMGNVWEWCWDAKGAYPEEAMRDPGMDFPETNDASRVVRGGSWGNGAGGCRSASRYDRLRDDRRFNLGFRLLAGQKLQGGAEPLAAEPPPAERGRAGGASRSKKGGRT